MQNLKIIWLIIGLNTPIVFAGNIFNFLEGNKKPVLIRTFGVENEHTYRIIDSINSRVTAKGNVHFFLEGIDNYAVKLLYEYGYFDTPSHYTRCVQSGLESINHIQTKLSGTSFDGSLDRYLTLYSNVYNNICTEFHKKFNSDLHWNVQTTMVTLVI